MTEEASPTPPAEPEAVAIAPEAASAPASASAPALASAPAPAPAPALALALATPYRTVPDAAETPFAPKRRASLVGGAVFVSGVLLWSFVIMGELTTSYSPGKHGLLIGEALAVVFVLATTAGAWRAALLRNLAVSPPASDAVTYARGAFVAVLALVSWWVAIHFATALGKASSKNLDGPITTLLLIVSLAASLGGRRLAGLHGPAATPRKRLVARLLWAGAGLLTFAAFVEMLAS